MEYLNRNPLGAVFLQGRARSFFESGLRDTFPACYEPFPVEIDALLQQLRDYERED
jgi:hypothetical protein